MGKITHMTPEHQELNKQYCAALKLIHDQSLEIEKLKKQMRNWHGKTYDEIKYKDLHGICDNE